MHQIHLLVKAGVSSYADAFSLYSARQLDSTTSNGEQEFCKSFGFSLGTKEVFGSADSTSRPFEFYVENLCECESTFKDVYRLEILSARPDFEVEGNCREVKISTSRKDEGSSFDKIFALLPEDADYSKCVAEYLSATAQLRLTLPIRRNFAV